MVIFIETMDASTNNKASSTDTATIVVVSIVAAMIVALLGIVIWQIVKYNGCDSDDTSTPSSASKRYGSAKAKKTGSPKAKNRLNNNRLNNNRLNRKGQSPRHAHRRYGVANPRATPHHEPIYDQPAPMPVEQLTAPTYMPPIAGEKIGEPTSAQNIGDDQMATSSTETQGTTSNHYMDSNYLQDPGMMTPSTATDIKGLQTFMPYMGGGVGSTEKDGPVDPNTGLPLFTTNKSVSYTHLTLPTICSV